MKVSDLWNFVEIIEIRGDDNAHVSGVSYDSREIKPGFMFVCVEGFNKDGHDYIDEAIENGAICLLVQKEVTITKKDITVVRVKDTRKAMAGVGHVFYRFPSRKLKVIGVTGTNGKTTTTYLIKSILEKAGYKVGLIGTIANRIGDKEVPAMRTTPEAFDLHRLFAEMLEHGVDYVVMEVSSHSLELGRVGYVDFDIGVFTNLSRDHLDFHGTLEKYLDAKIKLFKGTDKVNIINADDSIKDLIISKIKHLSTPILTYGVKNKADYMAEDIELGLEFVKFNLTFKNEKFPLKINIPGMFSVYNSLAAVSVMMAEGIPVEHIREGLKNVEGVKGRFETVDTGRGYSVIIDYAHTPDGLENVLSTIKGFAKGRVITMFGCGGNRDKEKRPLMGEVAGKWSDFVIITSDNPRNEEPHEIIDQILPGVEKTGCSYICIVDRMKAIEYALNIAQENDTVLLAGKGHETYQEFVDRTIEFDEKKIVGRILGRI